MWPSRNAASKDVQHVLSNPSFFPDSKLIGFCEKRKLSFYDELMIGIKAASAVVECVFLLYVYIGVIKL